MCEPVTIGAIAVGAGLSAYSQYKSGQAEASSARANAAVLEAQAADVQQRGGIEAGEIKAEGRRVAATATAGLAASGVETSVGSPAATIAASNVGAAIDAERTRANAAREAWGFRQEAKGLRQRSKDIKKAGFLGAAGSVLSGVGQIGAYRARKKDG